jgi:hypothetical protein
MAFSSTISQRPIAMGNMRVSMGTYSCASVATGDIDTGLRECKHIQLTQVASAVTSTAPVVDETLPVAGSAVTIVTASSAAGNWMAWGY